MSKNQDFKAIISEYIKKQMIILGPLVAVEKARKVEGLKVKNDGVVTQIIGNGKDVMDALESEYEVMIGSVAHTVLLRVIDEISEERKEPAGV